MSRWRIIPTRGNRGSRFVYGSPLDALSEAQTVSDERGCKVLVVEHPEDGLIRTVATIGKDPETEEKKRKRAERREAA